MPYIASSENLVNVAGNGDVEGEVPVIGSFVILFFEVRHIPAENIAGHCFDAIDQRMCFTIADLTIGRGAGGLQMRNALFKFGKCGHGCVGKVFLL